MIESEGDLALEGALSFLSIRLGTYTSRELYYRGQIDEKLRKVVYILGIEKILPRFQYGYQLTWVSALLYSLLALAVNHTLLPPQSMLRQGVRGYLVSLTTSTY